MSEDKNFLEQINEEKSNKSQPLESFKEEAFVKTKEKTRILPYLTIIIIAIIVVASYYFMTREEIIVLDFTGMEYEQVESWAELHEVMLLNQENYHPTYDEGIVTQQNHEAGYSLKPEDTVVVKVSKGPDPYEVIELPEFDATWSKSSIQAWLESNKVDNFAFKFVEDVDVEGDYLINYILTGAKEDSYSRSASLEFVFSQPDEAATVVMQNFLGDSLDSFVSWAVGEGFTYSYTQSYSNIYDEGKIMEQNFTPDTEKLLTDELEVVVSLGLSNESVVMTNLVNVTTSEASAWIVENGLQLSTIKRYDEDFQEGRVIEQNIEVGAKLLRGSQVELVISSGDAIAVPDFSRYDYTNYSVAASNYEGAVIVSQRYNETVEYNALVSQSISRGSITDGTKALEVIYSLGKSLLIPDFRNESVVDIAQWVTQQNNLGANLKLEIVEDPMLNEDYGVIFDQNYYNKSIDIDDTIQIVISTQKVIPDFAKMTRLEAETYAQSCGYPLVIEERYQLDTEIGEFIWQSETEGQEVNNNTLLLVRYSLGMKVIIDDYRDRPLSDFESVVFDYVEQGMEIDLQIVEQFNEDVPYGTIISQSIFNASITTGETIDVIVSLGESYFVQKFIGYDRSSVENLAEIYGLNIVYLEEDSSQPTGRVIKQSIEPGTTISRNEFIYITFAK